MSCDVGLITVSDCTWVTVGWFEAAYPKNTSPCQGLIVSDGIWVTRWQDVGTKQQMWGVLSEAIPVQLRPYQKNPCIGDCDCDCY
jgi:hypothetical protein